MCQKALANFIVNCPGRFMRTKHQEARLRTKVMLLGCGGEAKPGNRAVWPRGLAYPVKLGIAQRQLHDHARSILHLTQNECTSRDNQQNSGTFPRENFEEFFESSFRCVTDRNPAPVANKLLMIAEDCFSRPISFPLLE